MIDVQLRKNEYAENNCCWQYSIREKNKDSDIEIAIANGISLNEINSLKISDFILSFEKKEECYSEIKTFINKYEWLGKMSLYPTHIFTARYKNFLCGVVVMDMPNAFSKMLGEDTKKLERLISRGACISFSPKNLASHLISFSIKWMVKNTSYRLFTAYSDSEAKELGTIYQACNFYYLGKFSGSTYQYKTDSGWKSDRFFRSRSVYKKLAIQNGIEWKDEWQIKDRIIFSEMPKEIELKIKEMSKSYMLSCEKRSLNKKHKYAYVLGSNKSETFALRKKFKELNKIYPYPKDRGQ